MIDKRVTSSHEATERSIGDPVTQNMFRAPRPGHTSRDFHLGPPGEPVEKLCLQRFPGKHNFFFPGTIFMEHSFHFLTSVSIQLADISLVK